MNSLCERHLWQIRNDKEFAWALWEHLRTMMDEPMLSLPSLQRQFWHGCLEVIDALKLHAHPALTSCLTIVYSGLQRLGIDQQDAHLLCRLHQLLIETCAMPETSCEDRATLLGCVMCLEHRWQHDAKDVVFWADAALACH